MEKVWNYLGRTTEETRENFGNNHEKSKRRQENS
jgi:hypothetical protein